MDASTAAALTASVATLGVYLNAYETVRAPESVQRFFSWNVVERAYERGSWVRRVVSAVGPDRAPTVAVAQAVAATAVPLCLVAGASAAAAALSALVLGGLLYVAARFPFGFNGADQMQVVVWAGLVIFAGSGPGPGEALALGFIAAQAALAYVTAGTSKLFASRPSWRRGMAIHEVMRTETYGLPWLSEWRWAPAASAVLGWATMAFEILGPVSVLLGPDYAVWFVAAAAGFHVGIGVLMGLTSFVFSFGAALPALYWASCQVGPWFWGG